MRFDSKDDARRHVWDLMQKRRVARFPFPPHGRIANFAGARQAAQRLLQLPELEKAKRIKVNPDAPQQYVREGALRRGIEVFVPTPKLKGGFRRLDPDRIPRGSYREASHRRHFEHWGELVPLKELPQMDLVINGSVAVTRSGRRCGKGAGYGDLEYAILRELGHPPVPVLTTVHPVQIVDRLPRDPFDLPVSVIVTPGEVVRVRRRPRPPEGIEWERLPEEALEAMPVLVELRRLSRRSRRSRGR